MHCGAENLPRAKFCGACGTSLSGRTTTPASTPPTRPSGQAAPVGVDRQAINPIAYTPRHLAERILAEQLAESTRLRPDEINEEVALLVQRGHATCDYSQGRRPYAFTTVRLTPEGRAPFQQPPNS
jgi:hypothetical protein